MSFVCIVNNVKIIYCKKCLMNFANLILYLFLKNELSLITYLNKC